MYNLILAKEIIVMNAVTNLFRSGAQKIKNIPKSFIGGSVSQDPVDPLPADDIQKSIQRI